MHLVKALFLCCLVALAASRAEAQRVTEFCSGFSEGWKSLKGELTIVPICPIEPITPIGSTPFREGIKAGTAAANRSGAGAPMGGVPREAQGTFCGGFSEGWKSVKGDLALVPLCPLEPLTPLGSTPFREGIKAGMARARQ